MQNFQLTLLNALYSLVKFTRNLYMILYWTSCSLVFLIQRLFIWPVFYRADGSPRFNGVKSRGADLLLVLVSLPLLLVAGVALLHTTILLVAISASTVLNLVLPLLSVVFALGVILYRNPIYALLSLIGVFLATVLFYIGNGAEFIGLVLLIVYVGAVSILFLFVLMLLNVKSLTSTKRLMQRPMQWLSFFFVTVLFTHLLADIRSGVEHVLHRYYFTSAGDSAGAFSSAVLERYVTLEAEDALAFASLYQEESVLFIMITLILLTSMLGAIVLATSTLEGPEGTLPSHKVDD